MNFKKRVPKPDPRVEELAAYVDSAGWDALLVWVNSNTDSNPELDELLGTLASKPQRSLVRFVYSRPDKQAHIDDISRGVDGVVRSGYIKANRKNVETRYLRARRALLKNGSSWLLSRKDNFISLYKSI
jgi:hypothetical protein